MTILGALLFAATYDAEYVSAYDADTWTVIVSVPVDYEPVTPLWVDDMDIGVTLTVRIEEKIRIAGVDTPEIRGKCPEEKALAREGRDAVREMAESADLFSVEIDTKGREKYGRALGDILIDGERISEWLVSKGYAVRYDGGRRKSWCE